MLYVVVDELFVLLLVSFCDGIEFFEFVVDEMFGVCFG